jgi:protein-tyrosine phosphatase
MSRNSASLPPTHGVLFVCLGNICRSPLAAAIFRKQASEREVLHRFHVESCGTGGWHAGEGADPRSLAVALRNAVPMEHTARQLEIRGDAARFATIVAMDRSNKRGILPRRRRRGSECRTCV